MRRSCSGRIGILAPFLTALNADRTQVKILLHGLDAPEIRS